jgi:hypothetical protein
VPPVVARPVVARPVVARLAAADAAGEAVILRRSRPVADSPAAVGVAEARPVSTDRMTVAQAGGA